MRPNSREGDLDHELRPRAVRRGWGKLDSAKRIRAVEVFRERASRPSAAEKRRATERRLRVVREMLAGRQG